MNSLLALQKFIFARKCGSSFGLSESTVFVRELPEYEVTNNN